jgi:hypothetical protein
LAERVYKRNDGGEFAKTKGGKSDRMRKAERKAAADQKKVERETTRTANKNAKQKQRNSRARTAELDKMFKADTKRIAVAQKAAAKAAKAEAAQAKTKAKTKAR